MASQHQQKGADIRPEERSKRQERAERILDAAAELIQRWGYNKTTIDDIAKQARVAKGTIYLHWKTRESLFTALLVREYLSVVADFQQYLESHLEDVTLQGIIKESLLLSMSRPLIKAIILGDTDMLGALARREFSDPTSISQRRLAFGRMYIELLRSKGLMRTDISIDAQLHMLVAITIGFLTADRFLPEDYQLPLEKSAGLLAETIQRTFEPEEPVSSTVLQEVMHVFSHSFNQLIEAIKQQSQKEMVG